MLGNCDGCDKYAKLKDGLCADCRDAAEICDLRARVARLEGALRVYANPDNWRNDNWGVRCIIDFEGEYGDPGNVARAALAPDAARKEGV